MDLETEKKMFLLHSRLPGFCRKVDEAKAIIQNAFTTAPAWHVAKSGGKDSTVVLELVRSLGFTVPAVFSDDEWWLPETEEYLKRLQASGVDLRWIRTNARHTEWFSTSGDYDGIPDYARQQGFGGVFLGLRKDENAYRRKGLGNRGMLYYCKKDSIYQCSPIGNWSVRDVWAFIFSNNLDYNRAYDKLAALGIAREHQRIGPFAVERALGYGQLAILKRGWPEQYRRFADAHSEAASYA